MIAETEFIIQPYASAEGRSVFDRLISELTSGGWDFFWAAVAFAKQSGNDRRLLDALKRFVGKGGRISITLGADVFGTTGRGTEFDAVETLLQTIGATENVRFHLYHEQNRTFHPKIYLFGNTEGTRAIAIIGSSNWTQGGLAENIEANVVVKFDLTKADHRSSFNELKGYFERFWTEAT